MTEIAFHFGAPDKVAYASRLLRKVNAAGMRALAIADPAVLTQLDVSLWGVGQSDFVPHAFEDAPPAVEKRSTIFLKTAQSDSNMGCTVLVNLGDQMPENFDRFERVIEVVSTQEDDRLLARERWKAYTRSGFVISRHDLKLRDTQN